MSDNRPIGVFDSGLGGLTVVSALMNALPSEDIVYLGDTARVPYGDKSVENIIRFGHENSTFLLNKGVKAIIVACNTVSAVAVEELRREYAPVPVIGVLEAGVRACLDKQPESVAVLGTRATVNSDAYRRHIHGENPSIIVESIPCPLFVPLVEEGLADHFLAEQAVEYYLSKLASAPPDMLLLGCTHYPLLFNTLKNYLPDSVEIIDSAKACASFTGSYLKEQKLPASKRKKGSSRFFVTDMASDFLTQARRFLGCSIGHVEKISL